MKIELKHVEKKFPDATPLKDVNAVINDGDVIAIIGPSGTGKSTLMRCINMLDPPTSGQIFVDGLEITGDKANFKKIRKKMGMVFQSFNLFDHLTVIENVMFALTELKKMSKQEAYDIAIDQLSKVGLAEKALKYPDELSGGQKQRVSIARTLAMDPELILLDEPTSALDPTMVREVESVICNLAKSGKTIMIVTHEMRLARAISNRVFYLDQGVLYEDGTPEQIFDSPRRERTKAFIQHLKVFSFKFTPSSLDFNEYKSKLKNFTDANDMPHKSKITLEQLLSYVTDEYVPTFSDVGSRFNIVTEYSQDTGKVKLLLYCSDKSDSITIDSLSEAFSQYDAEVSYEKIEDNDYGIKFTVTI